MPAVGRLAETKQFVQAELASLHQLPGKEGVPRSWLRYASRLDSGVSCHDQYLGLWMQWKMEILLFVLIVVVSALTLTVFGLLFTFVQMSRKGKATSGVHFKKGDIEDLLSSGNTEAARADASIWRRQQPRNATAYQLLAKAHFQLKEYVECN